MYVRLTSKFTVCLVTEDSEFINLHTYTRKHFSMARSVYLPTQVVDMKKRERGAKRRDGMNIDMILTAANRRRLCTI